MCMAAELITSALFIGILLYVSLIYMSTSIAIFSIAIGVFVVASYIYIIITALCTEYSLNIPIAACSPGDKVLIRLEEKKKGFYLAGRVKFRVKAENMAGSTKYKKTYKDSSTQKIAFKEAGGYDVKLKYVKIYDLTGLFYIKKRTKSSCKVIVLPECEPVNVTVTEAVRNFFGDADVYDDARPGYDPAEKYAIRPFVNGDKLQSIHWKLSAKTGELMVMENSLPKPCPVVIMLSFDTKEPDRYIKLAASYSFSMMDMKCAHYVAWFSESENDVFRVRVDDEESYYIMLNYILAEKRQSKDKKIRELYNQKYRAENILHKIYIDSKMCVYIDDEIFIQYNKRNMDMQLESTELIL